MLQEPYEGNVRRRPTRARASRITAAASGATRSVGRALWPLLGRDIAYIMIHTRLFLGLALLVLGLLSFTSSHYCDGGAVRGAACTRPATYYFYPWWAILLVILGSTLLMLWWVRRLPTHEGRERI